MTTEEITKIFCKNVAELKSLGVEEEEAKVIVKRIMNDAIDKLSR